MFGIVDATGLQPHEISFVGPVLYDWAAIFARHDAAIRAAAASFLTAADGLRRLGSFGYGATGKEPGCWYCFRHQPDIEP
jgi:hypothetical protein